MNDSILYALDFDGVICDSVVETAMTGWKAAVNLWPNMPKVTTPPILIDQFRQVRPMIETGYEAILAMRLLYLGESVEHIIQGYESKINALMQEINITVDDLKTLFGETRDTWIADDLTDWVNENPLFPHIAEKLLTLNQRDIPWFVITTKQERFATLILHANGINLPEANIFGLDRKMSKAEVLSQLVNLHADQQIYFVEDRLPTLINVAKQKHLADVKLIFAEWGYNTDADKASALSHHFTLQSLHGFLA